MMNDEQLFQTQCATEITALADCRPLHEATRQWMGLAQSLNYSYPFRWLGLPIIQYPQDIVAMQELIWRVQPDLIIETGVARGGSLIFSASMLALLDSCARLRHLDHDDASRPRRKVMGIDIEIRKHNREAIEAHALAPYITLIEGSSIDAAVVEQITAAARQARTVLVCVDSNHSHAHVLAELNAYAPLSTVGSYCVVLETIVEDLPPEAIGNRPWSRGDSPKTAVWEYLCSHPEFEIDKVIDHKLLISVAPDGYLKRVS